MFDNLGHGLANLQAELAQVWHRVGPYAVEDEVATMDRKLLEALVMVNVGAQAEKIRTMRPNE